MSDAGGLDELGWSPFWQALFEPHGAAGLTPGRVVRSDRGSVLVATATEVVRAKPSVRLVKAAEDPSTLPVVGDWIGALTSAELEVPLIDAVLERRSAIRRGDPGKTSQTQVLAANVDTVFVVHPIAEEPNLRRIERELALAWDSGANPVVVLTKADLSPDPEGALAAVEAIAMGVEALLVNALEANSAGQLLAHVSGFRTAALMGPSGAGKSTLINGLLGEQRQATGEVRAGDGRGRHTTVAREMVPIAGHGVLIDTPGLRAIGQTGSEGGISSGFPDIEELARACRFRDCGHGEEPGCAVRGAIESGELAPERLASYYKLVREARAAARKSDVHLQAEETRKWKAIAKWSREYNKRSGR